MQLKVTIKLEFAIVIIYLISALAGCQPTSRKTALNTDNNPFPQTSSPAANSPNSSSGPSSNAEQPGKDEVQIVIENFVFKPAEITIAPGTKVTWINKDEAPHTATSTDKKFNSGGLDTNDKFSFVFNDKGDYPYFCALHPQMKAQIKVK
jgi:plastocyanin